MIRALIGLVVIAAALSAAPAQAYRLESGDQMVRVNAGGSFNFVRHRLVSRETPAAVLSIGAAYGFAFTDSFSVIGALRPGFADGYVDLPLSAGVRYRFPGLDAPLIPYGSVEGVFALGVPLGPPPLHLNAGVRAALGVDYFITGNFGVGLEFAMETGPLFAPAFELESSAELLLACGYRF